jgi:hypothetical protein
VCIENLIFPERRAELIVDFLYIKVSLCNVGVEWSAVKHKLSDATQRGEVQSTSRRRNKIVCEVSINDETLERNRTLIDGLRIMPPRFGLRTWLVLRGKRGPGSAV